MIIKFLFGLFKDSGLNFMSKFDKQVETNTSQEDEKKNYLEMFGFATNI